MGPYDLTTLQQLASNHQITPGTLAWIDGMSAWESIENIQALNGLFDEENSTPPPLPKT